MDPVFRDALTRGDRYIERTRLMKGSKSKVKKEHLGNTIEIETWEKRTKIVSVCVSERENEKRESEKESEGEKERR